MGAATLLACGALACAPAPRGEPAPGAPPAAAADPAAPSATTPATTPVGASTAAPPAAPVPGDTVPPPLGPPKPLTLPPVQARELPNGLRLLVVEQHEVPLVDAVLIVPAGGERDPAPALGLGTLTAALLKEGTTSRTSLEIADQEAFLGATIGAASGWDAARVTLHTPTAQLDSALALFADVALHPSFPAREVERLRAERLTTLLQMRDRPTAIADLAFASLVFGAEHPYGRPLLGTEATVGGIGRAHVREFYARHYRPNGATLIVVGDVQADDIERRVRRLFGDWPRGEATPPRFGAPPAPRATTVYLIDKPGAPQSSVRIGTVGVARSTEDYFPLLVANTVLGGSFTSRLNQNLRETRGYTYGAGSSFAMRQEAGPFTARAEVTATKTDSALLEFFTELRAIRDTVPADELEKAKRYLQLQLPAQFETSTDIAAQLVPVALYGLPLDYYNSYAQRIGAVTQADVQRVMQRYVRPEQMVVVVVGDRASIEAAIRAAQLGPVELRDISGERRAVP